MTEEQPPRKTSAGRAVDLAGALITSIADDDGKVASTTLKRITRQRIQDRVLIVLAVIAAGALKQVHGDKWKDHATDYPHHLDQEQQ
ncbi:hypothetical protein [Arthrobacter globiformis]|uniref:hypothetical protein n=1 Tax=Arthrobacter globiformis TaxID=1665 RepID=UPI002781C747|nr:hypothetical protein [Arthrobacter globiformis]MDQ0865724.1 hypothetical protein [Arthrobacter globiformis]